MENYRFAVLDGDDVDDVRRLESALAAKYGKNIMVIAYEQTGGQEQRGALQADIDEEMLSADVPIDHFSLEQAELESGYGLRH